MKAGLSILIVILTFGSLFSQTEIKPSRIEWKVGDKSVSLKDAYDNGIERPEKLGLSVYFDSELLKTHKKEDFTLEFRWFYYYSTTKEFMNKQVLKYEDVKSDGKDEFSVSSYRKNIRSGWWEVHVTTKYNGKPVSINGIKRFQVYVK